MFIAWWRPFKNATTSSCQANDSIIIPIYSFRGLTFLTCGAGAHRILGLLHNLGDGCRHTATAVAAWRSPRRGEIFMTAISSPRRHSSPFGDTHRNGDTHRHMATPIAIWRQASPRRDSRDNLITFCIQLVPMLSKRWQAGEIKKAKVEALQPYRHPRWLKELGVSSTHALTPSSDTTTTNSESDIEWTNKRLLK